MILSHKGQQNNIGGYGYQVEIAAFHGGIQPNNI